MGTPRGWRPNGARYRKSVYRDPIGNRGRWFRICGRRLPVTYRSPDIGVRSVYPHVSLQGRKMSIFRLVDLRHLSEFRNHTPSIDSPRRRLSTRGLLILHQLWGHFGEGSKFDLTPKNCHGGVGNRPKWRYHVMTPDGVSLSSEFGDRFHYSLGRVPQKRFLVFTKFIELGHSTFDNFAPDDRTYGCLLSVKKISESFGDVPETFEVKVGVTMGHRVSDPPASNTYNLWPPNFMGG
jgi:hypothetical protein